MFNFSHNQQLQLFNSNQIYIIIIVLHSKLTKGMTKMKYKVKIIGWGMNLDVGSVCVWWLGGGRGVRTDLFFWIGLCNGENSQILPHPSHQCFSPFGY